MWNFRNNLIYLFCLLAAACTTEEPMVQTPLDERPEGAMPVCFSLPEGSLTRATTRAASPLPGGETVRVLVYRAGSTSEANLVGENTYHVDPATPGLLIPCTVDATGMVTGLGEELFLLPGQRYDIHAYSPALPATNHLTVQGIGHGTDLLASKLTLLLDKYTSATNPITLSPLAHQCAMMDFTIQSDPADPSVLELSAESVTLKSMSRAPGSYTLNSTTGVSPNGTTRDADVKIEAFNKISDTRFGASQVVLPKAAGNFNLELVVLINGSKYTLTTPVINLALQAKTKYSWVVTCKRDGITLSFSVLPWQDDTFDSGAGTPAPLQEPANSFMVAPGGGISFAAARADGTALSGVAKAEVLWQTRDGLNPVIEKPAHVVWDSSNQRIRVYTSLKAANGGKAVVVARNASNQELYRWLVWATPYDPSAMLSGELQTANQCLTAGVKPAGAAVHTYDAAFLSANGQQAIMMDRNLGATSVQDGGCYFQHGSRTAYTTGSEVLYAADGVTRYTPPSVPASAPAAGWTPIVVNGTATSGTKSAEDPCPYGWRVPACNGTAGTWNAFTTATFTTSGSGRSYANGVGAYYPTGCWGTGRTGSNGYALLFTASTVSNNGSQSAATPLPVRCVMDAVTFAVGTPKMEPVTISAMSATSATFNSRMTSTGGATIQERGFYYASRSFADGGGTKIKALEANTSAAFTAGVSGLTQGATYHVQAYITTTAGTFYTPLVQFAPTGLPKVSTTTATSTAPTTATVTGNVDDTGGDATVKRGVVYSTTSNFDPESQGTQVAATSTGSGSYTVGLTGLQPGTDYYVRAYATNKTATVYGAQRNFTTVGVPVLSTPAVSNVTGVTATFRSTLTGPLPSPGVTSWGFEWSADAAFPAGSTTSKAVATPPYTPAKAFELNAAGMSNNTAYYVRAYAVNTAGKGYSSAVRFVTMQPPTVVTLPVSGVTTIGTDNKVPATFNGEVTVAGTTYVSARGFEYSTVANFAGGTGIKVPAGSGGTGVGKFAVPTNVLASDQTYYVRTYATNTAGTTYGGIQQVRLNYVAPTFDGVTLAITRRKINGLPATRTGNPQPGNAVPIAQGYAYQEEGTSGYIYNEAGNPLLKVYKEYTVYAYVKNAKGTYYSPASASETTLSNYYKSRNKDYVVDKASGEGYEAWTTGFMSLLKLASVGFPNVGDGYDNTHWLVGYEDWSIHPNAAKFCWNKPEKNGEKWFLADVGLMTLIIESVGTDNSKYIPELWFREEEKYWTSSEGSSMTAWYARQGYTSVDWGKNNKHTVRCVRKRVLPADEYAY